MNKHLLLGSALLGVICAYPQSKQAVKPIGVAKEEIVVVPQDRETHVNDNLKPVSTIPVTPPSKSNKGVSLTAIPTVTATRISGGCNMLGMLVSQSQPLQYNEDLGAVSFVHRASPTYTQGITNGNTGTMAAWITSNKGVTWDSTCIWVDASNLARYPQGAIYNPPSNTNIGNAYIVGSGPITSGAGWIGNWYASKKLNAFNKTPGTDMQAKINASASASCNVHQMSRYGFAATDDGVMRSCAALMGDPSGTTYLAQARRGAGIVKGVFAAGAFAWSMDSVIPSCLTRTSDGTKFLDYNPTMAWNESGTTGYVIMYGVRTSTTTASTRGYQPIVYKTTNSGATWALMPAVDWTTPTFQMLYDRLWTVNTSSTLVIPRFAGDEGWSATVDVNDNLHLVTTVKGHPINHIDSLDYYNQWQTALYQWPQRTGGWPYIYDFYTTASNGWQGIMVDSMYTEGPSGTSGQPGYTENPWIGSGTAGSKYAQDARIQVSRSPNGRQIFYSWTETDTSATNHHWNIFPDIKLKGLDVGTFKTTSTYNVTQGTGSKTDQLAYYHYMSTKAILTNVCGTNEIPFTVSNNLVKDADIAVDHYYLRGMSVPCSAYTISATPLSVDEKKSAKTTTADFDVNIYPNPASDVIATVSVNLKESKSFEITVSNAIGQTLQVINIDGQKGINDVDLDLSKFNTGVYFYSVKIDNAVVTKKLIVQ